jgi:orotate phosphoribosyltransferase
VTPIATLIEESGAVKRGSFALSDGSLIDYYVDKYAFETDPETLAAVTDAVAAELEETTVDLLAGPALGAVPLVTAASLELGVPAAFVRGAVAHEGTQARIEGEIRKGQRVVLLDDVSMTGGTILDTAAAVENAGGVVERVLVVVDRGEGAADRVSEAGYRFDALVRVGEDLAVE